MITSSTQDDPSGDSAHQAPNVPDVSHKSSDLPGSNDVQGDQGKVEQIASLVIARIENRLEHHLHTQMEMPSAEQAATLRERAPEVYEAWIHITRQKAETEAYVQRAQYEVPERLAQSGRPWAFGALRVMQNPP